MLFNICPCHLTAKRKLHKENRHQPIEISILKAILKRCIPMCHVPVKGQRFETSEHLMSFLTCTRVRTHTHPHKVQTNGFASLEWDNFFFSVAHPFNFIYIIYIGYLDTWLLEDFSTSYQHWGQLFAVYVCVDVSVCSCAVAFLIFDAHYKTKKI